MRVNRSVYRSLAAIEARGRRMSRTETIDYICFQAVALPFCFGKVVCILHILFTRAIATKPALTCPLAVTDSLQSICWFVPTAKTGSDRQELQQLRAFDLIKRMGSDIDPDTATMSISLPRLSSHRSAADHRRCQSSILSLAEGWNISHRSRQATRPGGSRLDASVCIHLRHPSDSRMPISW